MNKTILYHVLEEKSLSNGKLYRIKKDTKLRLICHENLLNKNIKVFCNLAKNVDECKFMRSTYHEYAWTKCETQKNKNDDFDKYVEIHFKIAGSFQLKFLIENNDLTKSYGGGDIIVEPELKLSNGEIIDLNCLQLQTVLPKLLGKFNEWEPRLRVTKECGYNMIHFTPIEELSRESNSSYSLRDHRKLNENVSDNGSYDFKDLESLLGKIYKEWGVLSISDLVYNHMSNDAPFLKECPDAGYNLQNSKFLRPAFIFDRLLYYLNKDIENGKYESIGIKNEFNLNDLIKIIEILKNELVPKVKFEEFYLINIEKTLKEIREDIAKCQEISVSQVDLIELWSKLRIVQDPNYSRLKSTVDFNIVRSIISHDLKVLNSESIITEKFEKHFKFLNDVKSLEVKKWLEIGIENVYLNAKYHFFSDDGPKYKKISDSTPLVIKYFYYPFTDSTLEQDEIDAYDVNSSRSRNIHAHNGWVMNHDPLINFASEDSLVYLKRELIAWGDSIKLRYGDKPEDSPDLWDYMSKYTINIANLFHGVRLDNCHNTPLHVAQYFLDLARNIRPDLYVIAELFTNNSVTDNIFVSKLGITSLIRESMNSWNARELSRLLHRFGGDPVGSFIQSNERPLKESETHAIFFDVTHDNKSLIKSNTVYDVLPRSALLLMCNCAYGSTRGYDELVPHEIDVVKEERPYARWLPDKYEIYKSLFNQKFVDGNSSIVKAKAALNKLHFEMGNGGFNEIFVDLLDDEVIAVTRSNSNTHESVILLARTAFNHPNGYKPIKTFRVPLKLKKILFEAILVEDKTVDHYKKNEYYINGIENYVLKFQEELNDANQSLFVSYIESNDNETVFHFKDLEPGTVIAFSFGVNDELSTRIEKFRSSIDRFKDVNSIICRLTFDELNILLYRVSEEELDEDISSDVYNIPNYGSLIFCGLQGFVNILEKARLYNDLGHPFYENLREGNWMMEYIVRRLKSSCQNNLFRSALSDLANWLDIQFNLIYKIPRYLIPAYFDALITSLYTQILSHSFNKMSNFIINGSSFIQSLAVASIQLVGISKSAKLPNTLVDGLSNDYLSSIAAGLPFFSHGIMRNWGRDTFISLKGLLLLTNRFDEAKNLILTYASCLRHGLIPNLLGEGKCARYNARDAIWWWLKGIKDYTECVTGGHTILNEQVYRLYPTDDSQYPNDVKIDSPKQKLSFIIQEALTVHVNGLSFTERNAGPQIDDHMQPKGFQNNIGVDLSTGFVYGGNNLNCGTWMDKMGSSVKAGNNGIPATPRDGSAVELVGLNRHILDWIIRMNQAGYYEYAGVKLNEAHRVSQNLEIYSWFEWANRIDKNFEKYFWVDSTSDDSQYINRREIYKDSLNSSIPWADYQLRPNFLIAISLAPQMINPENASKALNQCKAILLDSENSIGIKTLDPTDYTYNGVYNNSDDSENLKISHGFNYHNGPEWIWPIGYYLRSVIKYTKPINNEYLVKYVQTYLSKFYTSIRKTDWKSLPELTNENGKDCTYSCPSQAWSIASILEVCYEMANL